MTGSLWPGHILRSHHEQELHSYPLEFSQAMCGDCTVLGFKQRDIPSIRGTPWGIICIRLACFPLRKLSMYLCQLHIRCATAVSGPAQHSWTAVFGRYIFLSQPTKWQKRERRLGS